MQDETNTEHAAGNMNSVVCSCRVPSLKITLATRLTESTRRKEEKQKNRKQRERERGEVSSGRVAECGERCARAVRKRGRLTLIAIRK